MKTKTLFVTIIMLFACSNKIFSQEANTPILPKYIYCELVGTNKNVGKSVLGVSIGKNSLTISVDFGQISSDFTDSRLRDEDGKPMKFNSLIDALNWFGQQGWEFVQAYTVTSNNDNVYHWLLRIDTSNISDTDKDKLLNSLKTKKDFKE